MATVGIPAGTEIKFTDNGWHCGALYGNEGTITWISTNCVEPGTVIIYKKYSDPYDSGSSATVNIGQLIDDPMFSVNIRNEEILAYQGDASDPTFLYALDTSITVPGVWEDCPLPTSDKAIRTSLPPGLQNGLTAVCVSNYDDVVLNTNTTAILGDRQTVLEYIGDYHNWIGHDTIVFPLDTWDFTFPELGSVGGTVTDEDILNGTWDITGQVYDVDSGLSQDSVWYMAFNTSGVAFISAGYFTNAWENPLTATQNLNISTVEKANSYENVTIGTNNYVTIAAMDIDADRGSDTLTADLDVYFTVVDDDINPPFFDYLTWNGGTSLDTNQAIAGEVVVTARVNDVESGIAFATAPPYILVLDSDGNVAASNVFNVGSLVDGDARNSNTVVTAMLDVGALGCGTYTAHVIIVDADADRLDDRLMATNSILLDMAGNSVPVDNQYITAAGVQLEALAGEVTDGMINTGGWDMAVLLSHPFSPILLDAPDDPQYQVLSAATNWLWSGSWTNGTSVSTNFYATNTVQALDPGSFDMIDTGVYEVIWWAVSEDACDPGNMGTNFMLVVDDDIVPPEWT
ncbi:MAG TPA: hypothetical protein PLT67_08465, partial [Kiritimatiellia bacterium]|nr:hypothetical protein [Kiritimatiellia bacterium]